MTTRQIMKNFHTFNNALRQDTKNYSTDISDRIKKDIDLELQLVNVGLDLINSLSIDTANKSKNIKNELQSIKHILVTMLDVIDTWDKQLG